MSTPERVRSVDLTGREKQLRQAFRMMGSVSQRFAAAGRRTLPFLAQRRAKIAAQPPTIDEESILGPLADSYLVELSGKTKGIWGIFFLDAASVSVVLDGALGSNSDAPPEPCGRLTAAQDAVVRRMLRALTQEFVDAVRSELQVELEISRMERVSGDYMPPRGTLFCLCQIEDLGAPATMGMGFSFEAASIPHSPAPLPPTEESRGLSEALEHVELEVIAQLGETNIPLQQVLSLRTGDVLRLDRAVDEPVPLLVGGLQKFTGIPTVHRGQFAIEIRDWHES